MCYRNILLNKKNINTHIAPKAIRQGETLDHIALVTNKRVLINCACMDPRHHFPGLYIFGTTSGVTWQSRALTGVSSQSVKFQLHNSR